MSQTYDCSISGAQSDAAERARGINTAASAVEDGRLVVLPTDTLYGIGCDAFNPDAVRKLLAAKGRGPDMPVPVLVGSWDTIAGLVQFYTPQAQTLVRACWPGGLSIVIPQAPSLPWDLGNTYGSVMLRMPAHPVAIELLQKTGPMAVSSANISGQPPATTCQEAKDQLGESVAVYLDGGTCAQRTPSTIIDLTDRQPKILREGAVPAEHLSEILGVEL